MRDHLIYLYKIKIEHSIKNSCILNDDSLLLIDKKIIKILDFT